MLARVPTDFVAWTDAAYASRIDKASAICYGDDLLTRFMTLTTSP